jgi:excisionase family DNA binding protein
VPMDTVRRKRLLSIPEAAQELDIKEKSLRNMLARRDIESVLVGRLRKVPASALEAYIAARTIPALSRIA